VTWSVLFDDIGKGELIFFAKAKDLNIEEPLEELLARLTK